MVESALEKGAIMKFLHSRVVSSILYLSLPLMLASLFLYFTLMLTAAPAAGELHRITIATDDLRRSYGPSINANGTKIAFGSSSDFLGQNIPIGHEEIWLYDTVGMTFTRVTSAPIAGQVSRNARISADGTKIVFNSFADFLGQGIPSGQEEIWLYDTATMTVTRVTTVTSPGAVYGDHSINANGMKIAFSSDSDFLGQGIPRFQNEIWLYDTATMTVSRITTASEALKVSRSPSMNADGTKIAFYGDSDFLGDGDISQYEVWLCDTTAMTVTRLTTASSTNRDSESPSISADGTKIAFISDSDFLGQGIPDGQYEIWLYDTSGMTVTRITTASAVNRDSWSPQVSADGGKITFYSDSDFLGEGITDNQNEIWLYDTSTMTVTRLTTASTTGRNSKNPTINANGTKIAFDSDSDFLGQGIPQNQLEIWLYDDAEIAYSVYLPIVIRTP